jgi:hypothetical protein
MRGLAHMHRGRIEWILDITGLSAVLWSAGSLLVVLALVMPRGSDPAKVLLWAAVILFAGGFIESVVATFQSRFSPLFRRRRVRDGDEEVRGSD